MYTSCTRSGLFSRICFILPCDRISISSPGNFNPELYIYIKLPLMTNRSKSIFLAGLRSRFDNFGIYMIWFVLTWNFFFSRIFRPLGSFVSIAVQVPSQFVYHHGRYSAMAASLNECFALFLTFLKSSLKGYNSFLMYWVDPLIEKYWCWTLNCQQYYQLLELKATC